MILSTNIIRKSDFSDVMKRIMQCLALKYEYQVADILGFKRVAFSERKKRNSIPQTEIELLCHKESINLNWVLYGEGEMRIAKAAAPLPPPLENIFCAEDQLLWNELQTLTSEEKLQWVLEVRKAKKDRGKS